MTGTYIFYSILAVMMLAIWYIVYDLMQTRHRCEALTAELAMMSSTNPWKSQMMLMLKSGQHVGTFPTITKGSMLYGALIIEEAAETLFGLAKGIKETATGPDDDRQKLFVDFNHTAKLMAQASLHMRRNIGTLEALPSTLLSKDVAMEILDGITDLHVVTAGLGLACGLPGQAGYDRVSTSNLSKANPVTGVIDKDASGKWIKGSNYHTPYLGELLAPFYKGV
jgi:hypothetical protein